MKYFLLLLVSAGIISNAFAQSAPSKYGIKGIVIDSVTNQPLGFTTVALKDAVTKQPVKTALTKDNGSFEFANLANKTYTITFVYVSYRAKIISVPAFKQPDEAIDLGKVTISPSSGQLKEVSINEAKPLIKQEVDRIAYDVQADPEIKAQSVLDMIRKVPLLSVDANDNIKLKGSGNYKILINGKESALMAKSPSDVLKSMPATNIEKIEVITTPPAKYDAEGLTGIINIITKKNADQGYNGSVNGRANSVFGPGINLNLTMKQGKFGLAGFIGYGSSGTNPNYFGNSQIFLKNGAALTQEGSNSYSGHNTYGNAELSYEIDSLNLITGSYQFYGGSGNQMATQFTKQINGVGVLDQQYALDNSGYNNFHGLDASVNYQMGFKKKKDQLLTLSYKYSYSPNAQFNDNVISNTYKYGQRNYQQYNESGNKEHTIQLDYVQPVNKKINIEAGGKAILRNNYSDFTTKTQNTTTNEYELTTDQSNNFDYNQDVYSLYNSYQLKFEKWTAKAGLRIEHTETNARFSSIGTPVTSNYDNLIPSLSVQHNFKSSSVTFGFTQRIQRPGIYQLNPFVDKSNPKFINTGNPDLKPELNNTFELNFSSFSKNSITAGLSYAFSDNSIQNVSIRSTQIVNGVTDTITTTTFQNLGSNKTLGLNLNTNLSPVKGLNISINAQLTHLWLKGTYNGNLYSNDGFGGNVFLNTGYKFKSGYRIGFNGGYFYGDVTLQGRNGDYMYNSYVVGKDFLKNNKATISLVANNPYRKYFNQKSYTNTADFNQSSYYKGPYQSFAVRFNYRFGKLNSDIKKNQRGINNDDTKGGGGNKTSGN
ncbi:TonB-dependent receptor [Mucilaginibacter sp. HMF5004]|uniref:outer membrane beta-barrel family protein n=1 Tax=Mucilaginibacter rivuli TaxID=2857527 RepID=UPI001C5FCAA8|nr:outer membrane beta-barrel family protein [Mucilaginibacter rivuli]MBW4891257.1 TonB-dependent receptor [Mucilaginibacter rivuli]